MADGKMSLLIIFMTFCTVLATVSAAAPPDSTVIFHHKNAIEELTYSELTEEITRDVNARCVLCKFFVTKIVAGLESPGAKASIRNGIDQACRAIVNTTLCDTIGNTVMNYIETLIQKDLQPDSACVAANFCPAESDFESDYMTNNMEEIILTRELKSGIGCKMCNYFVDHIDQFMDELVNGVKSLIYPYCKQMPPPADEKCKDSIDKLFIKLENYISDESICIRLLHVCT